MTLNVLAQSLSISRPVCIKCLIKDICESYSVRQSPSYVFHTASQICLTSLHHYTAKSPSITLKKSHTSKPHKRIVSPFKSFGIEKYPVQLGSRERALFGGGQGEAQKVFCSGDRCVSLSYKPAGAKGQLGGCQIFWAGEPAQTGCDTRFFIPSSTAGCRSLQLLHQTHLQSAHGHGGSCIS